MAKKKNKVNKVNKVSVETYKATAKILGKTFTAVGNTISEAISNLKVGNVKEKCILIVERGENKKERILMPLNTFRLFNSHGLMREVAIKNASILFQGI